MCGKLRLLKIVTLAIALVFAACGSLEGGPDVSPGAEASGAPQTPDNAAALPADEAAVTAVNVGYGDAVLIEVGGQSFLVDTGAKKAGDKLLRALAARGVKRLSGVFLTHPHADHIGGLKFLAQRYEIGMIYAPAIALDMAKTDKLAADAGVSLKRLSAGDKVTAASGAVFEVLGPLELNGEDDNDNSLVLRLNAGGLVWLLTGDMQFAEETSLMHTGAALKADVLKVGNHGNPDATSDEFGRAVSPSAAVISTSTAEDDDSANPRVIRALGGAELYVTQDYALGVLMTAKGGEQDVADLEEMTGHSHRLTQKPSWIVTQIEYHTVQLLLLDLGQYIAQTLSSAVAESGDTNVGNARTWQALPGHTLQRDASTDDGHLSRGPCVRIQESKTHRCASRTDNLSHDLNQR